MTVGEVLAGAARWHVEQGDCLDVLRAMPDASVDAVVTDPPAGIAFMGKGWDTDKGGRDAWIAWLASIMREALRALRPGGHALVWALPRTSHWTATAIEDAGFEIRDVGVHLFGSGFPKSLDVSKAIDREAGATREVVGSQRLTGRAAQSTAEKGGTYTAGAPASDGCVKTIDLTAPATPLAERWNGWGTALKPASEHWILARKPLAGTVAANVAEHGTGAVNVDACRVSSAGNMTFAARVPDGRRDEYRTGGAVGAMVPSTLGRWPANVVLSHLPECREVGVRRVRGTNVQGTDRGSALGRMNDDAWRARERKIHHHGNADGTEDVPAFDCAPGCAVAALDEQSGERATSKPGQVVRRTQTPAAVYGDHTADVGREQVAYGDTGGASRFFYVAKASRAERNAGCEGLPYTWTPGAEPRTNRSGETRPIPGTTSTSGNTTPNRGNVHPTVKPLALMRWLARLVTPPGGVVLDPFTGSGSTGAACALEGFRFVGIEREPEYVEIARARIAHWEEQATAPAKPKRAPKPRPVPAPPPSAPRPADERQIDLFDRRTA